MIAGYLPKDLGRIVLYPVEMMFWLYCPISEPGHMMSLVPHNLRQFDPIIQTVRNDNVDRWFDSYVYLTAKTLHVEGNYIGNRPGWHIDGFGTEDINYIWSDRAPTEFIEGHFPLSDDCHQSMEEMEAYGATAVALGCIQTFPDKHLLKLNNQVIHRSPVGFEPGMRTFVKVSLSKDRYDLQGNSINHLMSDLGPLVERKLERNHPASVTAS